MKWCRFQIGRHAAGPSYRGHLEGMARRRNAAPSYPARPEPNFRSVHALIGPEDHGELSLGLYTTLHPDDVIEVEISDIVILRNSVVAETS